MPNTTDAEGDNIIISIDAIGLSFVTLIPPNILNINPTINDIGTKKV